MNDIERFRAMTSQAVKGKTIESLEWEREDGGYWIMKFDDGSEICFSRTMAELAGTPQTGTS